MCKYHQIININTNQQIEIEQILVGANTCKYRLNNENWRYCVNDTLELTIKQIKAGFGI